MQTKINKFKIPLLIIGSLLIIVALGFFGFNQFTNYQTEKIKREKETQALAEAQKQAIEKAQLEIEKLKEEGAEAKEKQKDLEQEVQSNQQKSVPQNITISAIETDSYLTGVVKIDCKNQEGSGTLWQIGTDKYILTNFHVVSSPYPSGHCNVVVHEKNSSNTKGLYAIYPSAGERWNSYTDISLLKMNMFDIEGMNSLPIQSLNYSISYLRQCPTQISMGSPVIIIGYPAFSLTSIQWQGEKLGEQTVRTITNGIVSSYDSSNVKPYGHLPYPDYFVSAKIDSGNSGGMALSKDLNGLCVLGIPTWLNIGNFETQGIIQNIHNVLYNE